MAELFDHIDELRRAPGQVAVATLVNTRGTTPRKEGAKMLVGEGGAVLGSVTIGGCVDAQVIEEAEDVLSTMRPRLLELNLGDEEAWEIGLTCGGTIEVFVEPLASTADDTAASTSACAPTPRAAGRGAIVTRLDGRRRQAAGARRRHRRGHASATRSSTSASPPRPATRWRAGRLAHAVPGGRARRSSRCSPRPRCCWWSAPATWPCR